MKESATQPSEVSTKVAERPQDDPKQVAERYRRQGRSRVLRADLVDVVSTVFVAIPVAIWLASGGLSGFGTFAESMRQIGTLAGLVGAALVCLMLLLAARIPAVDRAIGHDRALLRHRSISAVAVSLLGIHGVVLVFSYAALDEINVISEFAALLGIGDFLLTVLSFGLFLFVALTSIAASRARLPHEIWYVLHLVSYAAVAVAIPHQFSMGAIFSEGAARWYWAAMYVVSFGALLVFRFLSPLVTNLKQQVRVTRVESVAPDAVNIYVTGRRLIDLDADGGQFFNLRFLDSGLWWHAHPFATSAKITRDTMRFTVRARGKGTAALLDVKVGTRVYIHGPYGLFSDASRTCEALVLLGAGVGIAPVRAVLESTKIAPGKAVVILRASNLEKAFLVDEIEQLCQERGARLELLFGERDPSGGWAPRERPVTVKELVPWVADADVLICGSKAQTEAIVAELRDSRVPINQIHEERFSS